MSYIGKEFPLVHLKTVNYVDERIYIIDEARKQGKKLLLFWYPKDFTFVCPTELHAFQERLADFESKNTAVVGCSVDSKYSHWAWLNTPKKQGGIQGVTYPLVADLSKSIAENYDVLAGEYSINENGESTFEGAPQSYRGLFLIDKNGVVRHQVVNDFPLGRSIDEALRMVDALNFFEKNGEVCPANWTEGKDAMKENAAGVADYLSKH